MKIPKERVKSSIIILLAFSFTLISFANVQYPFIENSFAWNLVVDILVIVQLLLVGALFFKEILWLTSRKQKIEFLVICIILLFVNYLFKLDAISWKASFFWSREMSDGYYFGNILKALITSIVIVLLGRRYKMYNIDFILGFIIFVLVSFGQSIHLMLLDNMYIELMIILTLAICFDIFGYIGGSIYGKRRPFKNISRGKTVAGYAIGLNASSFVGFTLFSIIGVASDYQIKTIFKSPNSTYVMILVCLFLSLVAAGGDLLFSKLKRNYMVKDFSSLLPGHGGMLDRLDGIILSLFALGFMAPFLI